jgi:hypothetical protein
VASSSSSFRVTAPRRAAGSIRLTIDRATLGLNAFGHSISAMNGGLGEEEEVELLDEPDGPAGIHVNLLITGTRYRHLY